MSTHKLKLNQEGVRFFVFKPILVRKLSEIYWGPTAFALLGGTRTLWAKAARLSILRGSVNKIFNHTLNKSLDIKCQPSGRSLKSCVAM